MRGAERPNRVKWTRPFLAPLPPLNDDATLRTFVDIADDDHEHERVLELLNLTGNLPLAVNLIATVVACDGCDATLCRWKTESTRMLSDGYDKKSSLDISIMLSLASARMTPEAQELLSILSLLPDGLSDVELLQSRLPIDNVLAAKATLMRTSLAYAGKNNRLLALVPIREYVRRCHPPVSALTFSMRQYLHKLLLLWKEFKALPSPDILTQLSANLGNINAVLANGLRDDAPDIVATLSSVIVLSGFTRMKNNDSSPLMPLIADHVMRFPDDPVYGTYFMDKFFSCQYRPIPDPDAQIALANRYFDHASDLENGDLILTIHICHRAHSLNSLAQWYNALAAYYSSQANQPEMSLRYREMALSVTDSFEYPTKQRLQAITGMANHLCTMGNYVGGRVQAQKAQELAQTLGDLVGQAQAVGFEARCCICVGDFKSAARLCRAARDLLMVCGLHRTEVDVRLQSFEAEIHLLKTEYPEARAIHAQLVRTTPPGNTNAFDLLNLAVVENAMGADSTDVRKNLDAARMQFTTSVGSPQAVLLCDAVYATLDLRDGNTAAARAMFERLFVKLRTRDEGATFCLERLANLDHGMYDLPATLGWAGVYLASALKTKNKLSIMKALRCFGQIAVAQCDADTGLSLFQVALEGFTFMDVHWWKADCMARMAEISIGREEVSKGRDFFESALPLLERCSNGVDVHRIEVRLSALDTLS
jgi:hypothetical protein